MSYGRFYILFKPKSYLSLYILFKKIILSPQLAVGQFMTECFINHELYACRLHIGPSLGDSARLHFLLLKGDSLLVLMKQRIWHHGSTSNLRLRMY